MLIIPNKAPFLVKSVLLTCRKSNSAAYEIELSLQPGQDKFLMCATFMTGTHFIAAQVKAMYQTIKS